MNEFNSSWAQARAYLNAPASKFGLAALFICVAVYETLTNLNPYGLAIFIILLLSAAAAVALARGPRWTVYALLAVALVLRLYAFVIVIESGPQDKDSTRDLAVEATARSLMQGHNAWNVSLGVGVTTGPTSILVAMPFVAIFNSIRWLSYCFWVLFFLALLASDVALRNDSWPTLMMMFMLGLFALEHTMYWGLEELYYPVLYLAAAYWLVRRQCWLGVGMLCAACLLSRLNYVFMLAGFGLWYLFELPFKWKTVAKMVIGFGLGGALILLPFIIFGGKDMLANNPWRFAFDLAGAAWPDTNFVFHTLNELNSQIGPTAMRWVKLALALLGLSAVAWALHRNKVAHPFWHITAGALVAHTLVWLPAQWPNDYAIIFVLPAFIAIALTGPPSPASKLAEG